MIGNKVARHQCLQVMSEFYILSNYIAKFLFAPVLSIIFGHLLNIIFSLFSWRQMSELSSQILLNSFGGAFCFVFVFFFSTEKPQFWMNTSSFYISLHWYVIKTLPYYRHIYLKTIVYSPLLCLDTKCYFYLILLVIFLEHLANYKEKC